MAAILKEAYGKEFSTTHYSELKEDSFSSDSRDRGDRNDRNDR
ncbi:MAG: hypothetical protein Q8S84_00465 [bacterium]|nr:hypothetical protein [bacterium]MDP3380062.1 hypothetical protein [bacterium]